MAVCRGTLGKGRDFLRLTEGTWVDSKVGNRDSESTDDGALMIADLDELD